MGYSRRRAEEEKILSDFKLDKKMRNKDERKEYRSRREDSRMQGTKDD